MHNYADALPFQQICKYPICCGIELGNEWHKEHWFASSTERDEALLEMGKRHAYSRIGDAPSIRLEPLDR